MNQWAETRVGAEMRRAGIETRFAPRKLEVSIDRFELNPGKSDVVRFLNEHELIEPVHLGSGMRPAVWP